jgi:prepilin-type N-terminal cleavage/methylation domain-containing protein
MKLKASERGFTLIEMVAVIGIAAFVTGAASMAIITMMRLSPQNSDWAISLRQVQDVGYWISRDVQMSRGDIIVGNGNPTFLTLTLPNVTPPNTTIVYRTETMSGGVHRLIRNNSQTSPQDNVVAEYISAQTAAYDGGSLRLTFSVTAVSGGTTVTRNYEATQRVPTQ